MFGRINLPDAIKRSAERKANFVGTKWNTNNYGEVIVVEYCNAKRVLVRFVKTNNLQWTNVACLESGYIKDHNSSTNNHIICGVGYYGSGDYSDKYSQAYTVWHGIIRRCYDKKHTAKHPSYSKCTVCDEWLNFQSFKRWFEDNYVDGMYIDKDILVKHNTVYSPERCCFVPRLINNAFEKRESKRGEYPLGVTNSNRERNPYKAQITRFTKHKNLGHFSTIQEAFYAYKIAKEAYLKELANMYKDVIEPRVYDALMNYEVEITD